MEQKAVHSSGVVRVNALRAVEAASKAQAGQDDRATEESEPAKG